MVIGITGSRGILGRRLLARLEQRGAAVSAYPGDLRDPDALAAWAAAHDFAAVIHLAAIVDVARAEADPVEAHEVNVLGTLALLRALEREGRRPWFFYASTAHVYAPADEPLTEEAPLGPRGAYGLSKLMGERVAQSFAGAGGLPVCVGRIFSLFDPEQRGGYLHPASAARHAAAAPGTVLPVRDGLSVRDFSSATAVAAHIDALLAARATGVVNVGSGEGRRVVDQVAAWFGGDVTWAAESAGPTTTVVADVTRLRRFEMPERPLLSIVIPTFNRAGLLPKAIDSALAQTVPCEVVVVDHGSTDDTPAVVACYGDRVRFVRRETDDGPCIAWFDGVLRSTGTFVHIQYDDDWIAPTFAERTLARFDDEVGLVFTGARVVSEAGDFSLFLAPQFADGRHTAASLVRYLLVAPLAISPGCAVMRRKDALDALMMNPVFSGDLYRGAGPDLMLFLSTLSRYPAYGFIGEDLAFFRSHEGSITAQALKDQGKTQRLVLTYDEYKLLYTTNMAAVRVCGGWLHRAIELIVEQFDRLKIFG